LWRGEQCQCLCRLRQLVEPFGAPTETAARWCSVLSTISRQRGEVDAADEGDRVIDVTSFVMAACSARGHQDTPLPAVNCARTARTILRVG
jgi:hypothetical protein